MMRRARRSTLRAAAGLLIAAALVVVSTPQTASALPTNCTHRWDGSVGDDLWSSPANWDVGQVPGPASIACIGIADTVELTGLVNLRALHLDVNAVLNVSTGDALFVNGPEVSEWADGSQVLLDSGAMGGTGAIDARGFVELRNGSALGSYSAPSGTAYSGPAGSLNVAPTTGNLEVQDLAWLLTRYHIDVAGLAEITSGARITADHGTSLTIRSTGRLDIQGDGGYYQASAVAGQGKSVIVNQGTLSKSSGSTSSSVIDADYRAEGAGRVDVVCCTTLAIAGQQLIAGHLSDGMSMGTAVCGLNTTAICGGSTNPAVDVMSLKLHTPGNQDLDGQVQELGEPADTTDSRAVGNEVYAHLVGLVPDIGAPARIELRFSQQDVMDTPLNEVQVAHIDDVTGVMTKAPDCFGNDIPFGSSFCIQRPVDRFGGNTYVTVLTTETSRWRVRRVLVGENFDQQAPSAPTGLRAGLATPRDGSGVKLTWTPPADDGGAATKAYRIYRDGKLVQTTKTGTPSAIVKNSGPGKHVFKVQAVNIIGASPTSAKVEIKISKTFSTPRRVTALQGRAGGKLTAGAKWRPPASAGGYVIKKYTLAAFTPQGRLVRSTTVKAGVRKAFLTLPRGRYVFKVKAKNVVRWGPWSKATAAISPR